MKRLLVIDGHNLLFQMFFGMPSRIIGASGKAIQGVIGFVGAVNRMIDMLSPTHVAVIFDGEKSNPRKELCEEYKANRPDWSQVPEDENPFTQLPDVYAALDYMGIMHTETVTCETDDVIASYATRYKDEAEVYISSFDSDYFQLICERVKVVRYRGASTVVCDRDYITARYGVEPSLYLDFKCLVGDTSDNIRGIPGVGPKTAARIINEIGGIDKIKGGCERIFSEKIRLAIKDGLEVIDRNRELIRLDGRADIPFSLEELELIGARYRTMEVVRGIGL